MVWLAPAALAGLAAIAGPVLLHLLRRRTARRLVLPSTRFVVGRTNSAVRIGAIADPLLLLLRVLILSSAALALARPLWLTESRTERWAQRIARAIVVDTSPSARAPNASEAIAAERSSADPVGTFESADLGSAVDRAARWLADAPPARRELVILSDFQRGAVTEMDVARVPAAVGLRFVPLPAVPAVGDPSPLRMLVAGGSVTVRPVFDSERTTVRYSPSERSIAGLRLLAAPADEEEAASLMRVVSNAGTTASDPSEPILIRFPGADAAPSGDSTSGSWSFGAAQRMLRSLAADGEPIDVASPRDALVVTVNAAPSSLAAARAVKAALDARVDPRSVRELEPERIAASTLAAWTREPRPPDPELWRRSDESDGRWFWALALLLLGAETLLRRSSVEKEVQGAEAHAA